MNNIQNKKMKLFQNFFIVLILSLILLFVIRIFGHKQIDYKKLQDQDIHIIFNKNKYESITDTEYEEFKKNIISDANLDFAFKENYISIFFFGSDPKSKNIILEKLEKNPSSDSVEVKEIIKKVKEKVQEIIEKKDVAFYFTENLSSKEEKSQIKDFLTIKTGTNLKYFREKYENLNNLKFKIGKIERNRIKEITANNLKISVKDDIFINEEKSYNNIIKTKINKDKNEINSFYLKYENLKSKVKILVDDTGNLPIQWPNKIEWYFFLGWGYIWNILVIFIGYFLYFFSFMFFGEGWFFGNLGLGIILTTLLIRTLSWPIYTKTSTFSMNMSLAQPEINKIQEKYALKKDRESMQKMQMEIFKVYKKHNFSIFSIFISFLQMPILIAMFRTLNRFRNPGGIFHPVSGIKNLFLGCINLGQETDNNIWLNLAKIVLSLIVGISMYILNKINLQKPSYSKTNIQILNNEQKMKQKSQEMTMKIVNYAMIFFMVINSFNDSALSLYWITGNLYTILQIKINRKKMEKKYNILKNKSF